MNLLQSLVSLSKNLYLKSFKSYLIPTYTVNEEGLKGMPTWVQREAKAIEKAGLPSVTQRLYLIDFDKSLKTYEAKEELNKMGFQPVNFIECVLFHTTYNNKPISLPIISLNAYCDKSGSFKEIYESLCDPQSPHLCLCYTSSGFERPGEIEYGEVHQGIGFMAGVKFLVKKV